MDCTLLDYGKNLCKVDWKSVGTDAVFYKLYYCIDGKAIYDCYNEQHILTPNNLYIIQENTPYEVKVARDCFFDVLWFHVDFYLPLTNHLLKIPIISNSFEYHIIKALQFGHNLNKENILSLLQIISHYIIVDNNNVKSFDYSIEKAILLIKEKYNTNISNKDVALELGYNKNYFVSKFKSAIGVSPHSYLKNIRMSNAKKYLNSLKSVSKASSMVGYDDPNVFSRDFKKYFGYSASKYMHNPNDYI